LAVGLFIQTAIRVDGDDNYKTIHDNQHALLHRDSALCSRKYEWVVYSTFLQTSKQFLTTVTAIEPEWIMVSLHSVPTRRVSSTDSHHAIGSSLLLR
jgi:pre-mRNA-splicing factor ATP-dependent RNA helicase DHX15/PRP43